MSQLICANCGHILSLGDLKSIVFDHKTCPYCDAESIDITNDYFDQEKHDFSSLEYLLMETVNNLSYGIKQVCDPKQFDAYMETELGINPKIIQACESNCKDKGSYLSEVQRKIATDSLIESIEK